MPLWLFQEWVNYADCSGSIFTLGQSHTPWSPSQRAAPQTQAETADTVSWCWHLINVLWPFRTQICFIWNIWITFAHIPPNLSPYVHPKTIDRRSLSYHMQLRIQSTSYPRWLVPKVLVRQAPKPVDDQISTNMTAEVWMSLPQNAYTKALILNLMAVVSRTLGQWLLVTS